MPNNKLVDITLDNIQTLGSVEVYSQIFTDYFKALGISPDQILIHPPPPGYRENDPVSVSVVIHPDIAHRKEEITARMKRLSSSLLEISVSVKEDT